jgi:hypothetical protein
MKESNDIPVSADAFRLEALALRGLLLDAFRLAGSFAIDRTSPPGQGCTSVVRSGIDNGSHVRMGGGGARRDTDSVRCRTGSATLRGVTGLDVLKLRGGAMCMPPGADARTLGCTGGAGAAAPLW